MPTRCSTQAGMTSCSTRRSSRLYWFCAEIMRVRVLGQGDPVRVGDPEAGVVGGADVAHLALHDQLVEGGDRLLQWRLGIGAMLLVEVDVVGLEPAQAGLDRAPDVATGAAGLLL